MRGFLYNSHVFHKNNPVLHTLQVKIITTYIVLSGIEFYTTASL